MGMQERMLEEPKKKLPDDFLPFGKAVKSESSAKPDHSKDKTVPSKLGLK